MRSASHIPVVDMAAVRAHDPAGLREAAAAIRDACTSIGFFYVSNHGVPADVLDGDLDPFMEASLAQRLSGRTVAVEDVE